MTRQGGCLPTSSLWCSSGALCHPSWRTPYLFHNHYLLPDSLSSGYSLQPSSCRPPGASPWRLFSLCWKSGSSFLCWLLWLLSWRVGRPFWLLGHLSCSHDSLITLAFLFRPTCCLPWHFFSLCWNLASFFPLGSSGAWPGSLQAHFSCSLGSLLAYASLLCHATCRPLDFFPPFSTVPPVVVPPSYLLPKLGFILLLFSLFQHLVPCCLFLWCPPLLLIRFLFL